MPKPKFYITTPIYYTNAEPHIGSAYTTIIADALARWHKSLGEDVFFLTGTDEHGQKIQEVAENAGMTPKEFVDKIVLKFKEAFSLLNISNNNFIRTTDPAHETEVQKILQDLYDKKFIYKGNYESYYCIGCEQYVTRNDLVDGKCPLHNKEPELRREEAYLFKLSAFQKTLLELIKNGTYCILPEQRRKEITTFIEGGLQDISISRLKEKVHWGIELPFDKKHTCFVWVDAFWSYITGLKKKKAFDKFWPADTQLMAKDILRVHATIWPALLLATGNALPKTLFVHGYFTVAGQKMSKSLGNVISPIPLTKKYGTDALRYFLLREIPAGADGDFSEQALIARANADLGDTLGNLLQRTSVLVHKNFAGQIPKPGRFTKEDKALIENANKVFPEANEAMQKFEWHKAVETVWNFAHACNKYVNDAEPWNLEDKQRLGTVLYVMVESLRLLSILTYPFVPATAENISRQLGQKLGNFKQAKFKRSIKGTLAQPEILFKKIEPVQSVSATPTEIEPFRKLMLRVAVVEDVQPHPNADKLYVLKISLGTEKRQLVAGMRNHYQPDQLKGKHIVVVANLKPAMLRGVESQGMLLAAQVGDTVKVLEAPNSPPGSDVYVQGIPCEHDQITIDDFAKVKLTTKNGKAVYKDKPLRTEKEEIIAPIGDNAIIK